MDKINANTKSILCIPIKNYVGQVLGVVQFAINKESKKSGFNNVDIKVNKLLILKLAQWTQTVFYTFKFIASGQVFSNMWCLDCSCSIVRSVCPGVRPQSNSAWGSSRFVSAADKSWYDSFPHYAKSPDTFKVSPMFGAFNSR